MKRTENKIEQQRADLGSCPSHFLCLSSVFVGLNIINLLKDSMKLEQTCIYSVATNTQDKLTAKDKEGERGGVTDR